MIQSNVIWATESIDEDKRRQEELRKKAETDALTKILNRRGGETRIFEAFESGAVLVKENIRSYAIASQSPRINQMKIPGCTSSKQNETTDNFIKWLQKTYLPS